MNTTTATTEGRELPVELRVTYAGQRDPEKENWFQELVERCGGVIMPWIASSTPDQARDQVDGEAQLPELRPEIMAELKAAGFDQATLAHSESFTDWACQEGAALNEYCEREKLLDYWAWSLEGQAPVRWGNGILIPSRHDRAVSPSQETSKTIA